MKSTAEGPKKDGLRLRIWCGHYGDRLFWLCGGVSRTEKDDGEGGTSGLSLTGGVLHRFAKGDQALTA